MYFFTHVFTVLTVLKFILPVIGIHDYDNGNASIFIQNDFNCIVISEIIKMLPFLRNQDICEWYIVVLVSNYLNKLW